MVLLGDRMVLMRSGIVGSWCEMSLRSGQRLLLERGMSRMGDKTVLVDDGVVWMGCEMILMDDGTILRRRGMT